MIEFLKLVPAVMGRLVVSVISCFPSGHINFITSSLLHNNNNNVSNDQLNKIWLVGCGLTSHSAIFQIYSDGTVVQFPNFDLLPGTQGHGQLGVFSVPSQPDTGTGMSDDIFYLLAIRGPTCSEGMPGIEPGSSDPQSSPQPLCHCSSTRPVCETLIQATKPNMTLTLDH